MTMRICAIDESVDESCSLMSTNCGEVAAPAARSDNQHQAERSAKTSYEHIVLP